MAEINGFTLETKTIPETTRVSDLGGTDLVLASAPDGSMKSIEYDDFASSFTSGIANATTSTFPTSGVMVYNALESGTYTNFIDKATGLSMIVTTGEFSTGLVQFLYDGGQWRKTVRISTITKATVLNPTDTNDVQTGKSTADYIQAVRYTLIPEDSTLGNINGMLEAGIYRKDVIPVTYPNSGLINTTTGAFSALANRPCTDFIDVTGYTHIEHSHAYINSATGTAFYDADDVFIAGSGIANTGTKRLIPIPPGAKKVRSCTTLAAGASDMVLLNIVEIKENEIAFWLDGDVKKYINKEDALEYAPTDKALSKAVAYKPGTYLVKDTDYTNTSLTDGYIQWGSGAEAPSGNYKRTGFLNVENCTHLLVSGVLTGNNSVTFYANNTIGDFMSGTVGLAVDVNSPYEYPIPTGAKFARVAIHNSTTNKIIKAQKWVTVNENEIAFIEDGEALIYKGGGSDVPISGAEIIEDLPLSDGSSIAIGDAYINSATGAVIVKQ